MKGSDISGISFVAEKVQGRQLKGIQSSLGRSGDFTRWISEEVIEQWRHANKESKVDALVYSDMAIETILTLRELLRLTYRSTEGFGKGVMKLKQIDATIPDFTSLAKRAKKITGALNASKKFAGDGAYDKWKVYQTLSRRGIAPIIPPRRNAKMKRNGNGKSFQTVAR